MIKRVILLMSVMLCCGIFATVVRAEDDLILYVQEGCGHCAKVEKFIEDNDLGGVIAMRDTIIDPGASEEYTEYLDSKEVPVDQRGVPLLVINGADHRIGDSPIISYLREAFGIEEKESSDIEREDAVLLVFGGGVVVSIFGYGIYNGIQNSKKK